MLGMERNHTAWSETQWAGGAAPAARRVPHSLLGADFLGWLRLLFDARFSVSWCCWPTAASITAASLGNTLLRCVQAAVYAGRVTRTELAPPPVFVLGHWRSGTTFLHELLCLDPRHTYPTTYACFNPNHFLLTERLFTRLFPIPSDRRRPMDGMPAGWQRPQEDEFAIRNLGRPSPYVRSVFPGLPHLYREYLDLAHIPQRALRRWKRTFLTFLKQVTFRRPGRLVLKSPPHTFRIPVLLELFPDARFVYIVRNPLDVVPSAVKTVGRFDRSQRLHTKDWPPLWDYFIGLQARMHERVEQTRQQVAANRFHEARFEDLIAEPEAQLRRIYEVLQLGPFEPAQPAVRKYVAATQRHEHAVHEPPAAAREEIRRRLAGFMARHGYAEATATG